MKRKDRIILLILFVLFFAIFLLLPIIRRQVLIANEKSKTKVLEKQIEEQKKIKEGLEKEIKDSGNSENIVVKVFSYCLFFGVMRVYKVDF